MAIGNQWLYHYTIPPTQIVTLQVGFAKDGGHYTIGAGPILRMSDDQI